MILEFLRAGGFSIWLVLVFTVLLLVTAGRFALRPNPRSLALIRALTLTLLFSSLAGVATNFMAMMFKITENPEWAHDPDLHLIVMGGLGESVTPAVLGLTALSLAWLFVAVGTRRRDDLETDT